MNIQRMQNPIARPPGGAKPPMDGIHQYNPPTDENPAVTLARKQGQAMTPNYTGPQAGVNAMRGVIGKVPQLGAGMPNYGARQPLPGMPGYRAPQGPTDPAKFGLTGPGMNGSTSPNTGPAATIAPPQTGAFAGIAAATGDQNYGKTYNPRDGTWSGTAMNSAGQAPATGDPNAGINAMRQAIGNRGGSYPGLLRR